MNQRPLGYEFYKINRFIELACVVGCHERACEVLRKSEEFCVWVGFGLRVDPNVNGHKDSHSLSDYAPSISTRAKS